MKGLGRAAASLVTLAVAGVATRGLLPDGWAAGLGISGPLSVLAAIAVWLVALWLCLYFLFCAGTGPASTDPRLNPTDPAAYQAADLGPLPDTSDPADLYIDMVKRTVANVPYEDLPLLYYDHRKRPELSSGFDLQRRVNGEDAPSLALTMIGIRRLQNIHQCIDRVLADEVPGDLIETGSFQGGATIFMRAVLKARQVTDRRVFVCDAFVPPAPQIALVVKPILAALASIPSRSWRHAFYNFLQRLPNKYQAFPLCENPSQDWIDFFMWALRHPPLLNRGAPNSLDLVRSHFARYGLLDDQVVFLQGFFAETLAEAPVSQLAVMRLDGDTYESTVDAIRPLYPKLSPGGFCIIDDYHSFDDCRRAVDEYRQQHAISEPLTPIDNLGVFWRKSTTATR